MAILKRVLNSGDVMVFDKSKRELYLVGRSAAKQYKTIDLKTAKELAKEGSARVFSSSDLAAISEALSTVVLLGE